MKAEPSCHQPVEVRSPGVRLAAGTDYVGPLVVGEQQQDVGQLGRRAAAMSKASAGFQLVTCRADSIPFPCLLNARPSCGRRLRTTRCLRQAASRSAG